MNPRCPKCGRYTVSQMKWNAGGAIVRYWCPRCGIEVRTPETAAIYKTVMNSKNNFMEGK